MAHRLWWSATPGYARPPSMSLATAALSAAVTRAVRAHHVSRSDWLLVVAPAQIQTYARNAKLRARSLHLLPPRAIGLHLRALEHVVIGLAALLDLGARVAARLGDVRAGLRLLETDDIVADRLARLARRVGLAHRGLGARCSAAANGEDKRQRERTGDNEHSPRSCKHEQLSPSATSSILRPHCRRPQGQSREQDGAMVRLRATARTAVGSSGGGARRQALLEPVVGVRLVVERGDLAIAGRAIHRDRLDERAVGLEPDHARAVLAGARLELGEQAATDAEAARRRGHPHALDLGGRAAMELERAA